MSATGMKTKRMRISKISMQHKKIDRLVLEFDDVSGKDANVSRLVADGATIERLQYDGAISEYLGRHN